MRLVRSASNRLPTLSSALALALLSGPATGLATAATTNLVSVASTGTAANNSSDSPALSIDGRYVAFASKATNLVAGDAGGRQDIFVHDQDTGTTVRVSIDAAGNGADRDCENPSISEDGRYVSFDSSATNLVPGDDNGARDVFRHDRDVDGNGIFDEAMGVDTIRVSVDGSGDQRDRASSNASISGDGRFVAFQGNKGSGKSDILVWDAATASTTLLSVNALLQAGSGDSENPELSSTGRYLVFESNSSNLVAADDNGTIDVFLVDRDIDENDTFDELGGLITMRASVDSAGIEGNDGSRYASVSDDGRYVVFSSTADNLVPGDTNGKRDIFLHDFSTQTTERVSVSAAGSEGDAESTWPMISASGRNIAFQSAATNLAIGVDGNGSRDVFIVERDIDANGVFDEPGFTTIFIASVANDGSLGNSDSGTVVRPALASNGVVVAFDSPATNLTPLDDNSKRDVFVRFTAECGDNILTEDEECEDGNDIEGDGCDSNCTVTGCGNGITSPGEECEDGNDIDGDGCDSNCTTTRCGNGVPTAGEQCDDGDEIEGNGCDSNCTFSACGNGIQSPTETCDEGTDNEIGGCCSEVCELIDFDNDGICNVDDLADLVDASLSKVDVKDTSPDGRRPSGSVLVKGELHVGGTAPYFSPTALLEQAAATGIEVSVYATAEPPTTSDVATYSIDFAKEDCSFLGGSPPKKARCKVVGPDGTITKATVVSKGETISFKATAKRAISEAPEHGPLRVVFSLKDANALEFQAFLDDCSLRGRTRQTLKCKR